MQVFLSSINIIKANYGRYFGIIIDALRSTCCIVVFFMPLHSKQLQQSSIYVHVKSIKLMFDLHIKNQFKSNWKIVAINAERSSLHVASIQFIHLHLREVHWRKWKNKRIDFPIRKPLSYTQKHSNSNWMVNIVPITCLNGESPLLGRWNPCSFRYEGQSGGIHTGNILVSWLQRST